MAETNRRDGNYFSTLVLQVNVTISGSQGRGFRLRTKASPQAHQRQMWCSDSHICLHPCNLWCGHAPLPEKPFCSSGPNCSLTEGWKSNTLTSIHSLHPLSRTHSSRPTWTHPSKPCWTSLLWEGPLSPPPASNTQAGQSAKSEDPYCSFPFF